MYTCSPRVVGQQRADFHCLKTLLASPQFAGQQGQELVLAMYDYFTSKLDGTYHFWPMEESAANPALRRSCFDPIRLMNFYGWAICGQTAHALFSMYRAAGLKARLIGLPGHALCEVFFDDRWHILDVDMWNWYRTPQGHIASAYELAKDPHRLIVENTDKSDPCDLPDRRLSDYADMYAKTPTVDDHVQDISPDWENCSHNMDFRLLPGLTLTRGQDAQGRWHMPRDWKANLNKRYVQEWVGYPRERYEPFRSYGNGRWTYQPNLSGQFCDFAEGLLAPSDLAQDEQGLVGPGEATLRVYSPYPFAGRPDWSSPDAPATDGIWISAAGSAAKIEITDANGQWHTVLDELGTFDRRVDISARMDGRYECLVRLTLPGSGMGVPPVRLAGVSPAVAPQKNKDGKDPGQDGWGTHGQDAHATGRLTKFIFDGYIMTAPLTIPRLVQGSNLMELRCLDKRGLATTPWSKIIDFRTQANVAGQCHSAENVQLAPYVNGWQMAAPVQPDRPVRLEFKFDAPAGRRFAWLYVHSSVREGPLGQPLRWARLEYSADGRHWRPMTHEEIGNSAHQWDVSVNGEAALARPAGTLFVAISSETPITDLEFHGHVLEKPITGEQVRIVHRWREGEKQCRFTAPAGATSYTIDCGPNPAGHAVEMNCPSVRK